MRRGRPAAHLDLCPRERRRGGVAEREVRWNADISGTVCASGTAITLPTTVVVPSAKSAAARPISSSPGRTSERPDSQAESTSVCGARAERLEVVDRQRAVGEAERREQRVVGAEAPVGGDVRERGAVERAPHGLGAGGRADQHGRVRVAGGELRHLPLGAGEARARRRARRAAGGAAAPALATRAATAPPTA